jgi:CIC family chloride channel protein
MHAFFHRVWSQYLRSFAWLQRRLSRAQFLVLSGAFVGITAGFAGIALKTVVHSLRTAIGYGSHVQDLNPLIFVLPLAGIVITVMLIRIAYRGRFRKGLAHVLLDIAQRAGIVPVRETYAHALTSSITVGLGGSAGLEAPIVITGAAIGSNYARVHKLEFKDRIILIAAGSAAGISAIFNAPIAGVMFAIEVLLLNATAAEMVPLIVSSVAGALCSKIVLQEDVLLVFSLQQVFDYRNVPYYVGLGIVSGFMSLYYAKAFAFIERQFDRFRSFSYARAFTGGTAVAVLIIVFPPLFGEGYNSIRMIAEGGERSLLEHSLFASWAGIPLLMLTYLAVITFVKVIATATTLGSGGNGGNFGPSLFVGAFTGFVFAQSMNTLRPGTLPASNFAIVGMAGILSGVMYAPLTGIFLIAEITGGYELIIPLMIVSSLSYLIVYHVQPHSLETRSYATRGHIFTDDTDGNVLTLIRISSIIERDVKTIAPNATLRDIVSLLTTYRRNVFAVVENDGAFRGVLSLDDLREVMFQEDLYDVLVAHDLLRQPPARIRTSDDMRSVMDTFVQTHSWSLPVLDGDQFVGFLSKASIFDQYREKLKHHFGA